MSDKQIRKKNSPLDNVRRAFYCMYQAEKTGCLIPVLASYTIDATSQKEILKNRLRQQEVCFRKFKHKYPLTR
jgi:hypothetical protein